MASVVRLIRSRVEGKVRAYSAWYSARHHIVAPVSDRATARDMLDMATPGYPTWGVLALDGCRRLRKTFQMATCPLSAGRRCPDHVEAAAPPSLRTASEAGTDRARRAALV
jgi:hypothetical protein